MKKNGLMRFFEFISFLNDNTYLIAVAFLALMTFGGRLEAAAPPATGSADTLWLLIQGLVETWVSRLGGVVMFVGGIMFALGWKNDDAEGKSRGISTIIAGAIVVAISSVTATFFA